MYIPSRERIRRKVEAYREAHRVPVKEFCLICKRPMPQEWVRADATDDPVCPSCSASPIRAHVGWGGYAGEYPDISGGDSGWDNIVRSMEDNET